MTPQQLRDILESSGLTQRDAAAKLGVSRSTLNRWLKGESTIDQANSLLIRQKLKPKK